MNDRSLYAAWGTLFIVCAALGFIPEPTGFLRAVLTVLALTFFLPPVLLLRSAKQHRDRETVKRIRSLSIASLAVTLVVMAVSIATAVGSEILGNILHGILVIVSSPMFCSGYWALSLFLWACLLGYCTSQLRRK